MGYKELIDALRREGEEKVLAIWQEAETEAQKVKEEALKRVEELKEEYNSINSSPIKEQTEAILLEAGSKAKTVRLLAEKRLLDRLYHLAVRSLHLLRNERYKDIFDALVNELPHNKWRKVRVNPADEGIAKRYFPNSDVIPDSNISGGLDVMEESGGFHIINTFEKRLEKAWMEILPGLIKDIKSLMPDTR
jgi:vacuolar-type H+-ATPase subunit E/Vma4